MFYMWPSFVAVIITCKVRLVLVYASLVSTKFGSRSCARVVINPYTFNNAWIYPFKQLTLARRTLSFHFQRKKVSSKNKYPWWTSTGRVSQTIFWLQLQFCKLQNLTLSHFQILTKVYEFFWLFASLFPEYAIFTTSKIMIRFRLKPS